MILRGAVEDTRKAGPAKEAAIASACLFDRWSQEILDCIGGEHEAHGCLAKLSEQQRGALDTKLTAWTGVYENEIWETAEDQRIANQPAPIACSDIINPASVRMLAPTLTLTGEEHDFAVQLRRFSVELACEAWPQPVRACVQDSNLGDCRKLLAVTDEQVLAGKLAAIDVLMVKLAAAKKQPASTSDCKAVVAAHYGDPAWRGKAEAPKDPKATRAELTKQATERKQRITSSRKLMLEACTGEAWSATLRACELVESGLSCAHGSGRSSLRWGFPAAGVMSPTGIPECDAYQMTLQTLLACNKLPRDARNAFRSHPSSSEVLLLTLRNTARIDPELMRVAAVSCKQGNDTLRHALSTFGCTP